MSDERACADCGHQLQKSVESFEYDAGGVVVTLANAVLWRCPSCPFFELEIENLQSLHETIASILLEERRALSGPELRWLRKFVGVPRQLIAKIIPPSSDQILAWETGREPVEERYSTCIRLLAAQRVRVTDFREFEQHVEEAQASSRPRPRIAKRGLTWEPEPVAA